MCLLKCYMCVWFICRDGHPLTDDEVAGMLIGLLLAGQHTSSTTSAWMGFFLARDKTLQEKCYLEQKAVCGENLPPLTYDQVCWVIIFIAALFEYLWLTFKEDNLSNKSKNKHGTLTKKILYS